MNIVLSPIFSISVVPNAPPDNVQVLTLSSTAILVTWDPVPEISRNGIITQYEVEVNQSTFNEIPSTRLTTTNDSVLMVELGELAEDVEYAIRVRAYTSEGPGPFSVALVNRTLEDSEHACIKYQLHYQDSYIYQSYCATVCAHVHVSSNKCWFTGPEEVPRSPLIDEGYLTPFSAVVRWDPPTDPNGVILHYTVNYVAVPSTLSQDVGRHRRQIDEVMVECILGGDLNINRNMTVDGTQTTATLTELSEYA